jgi:hypothetical protein
LPSPRALGSCARPRGERHAATTRARRAARPPPRTGPRVVLCCRRGAGGWGPPETSRAGGWRSRRPPAGSAGPTTIRVPCWRGAVGGRWGRQCRRTEILAAARRLLSSAVGPRARDVTCRRQIRGRSRASGSRASSWRGPHRDSSGCDEKLSLCDHASEQPLAGGGRPNPSVVLCNDGATAACGPSKIQQCWQLARHAPAGGLELARQRTRDAQARARDVEVPAAAQRSRNGGMGGGGEEGCDSGGIFDLFTRTLCAD